ncbi:hypothetical protein GW888_01600 [Candidatus Wolfebacteria bacterium]|uniref:Thioredoxin domain-containing protein n=2 Tax=Parcubacteria group TaxID=1794811 RepID=A0A2M7H0T6_9BACT|nr:hypothetical protein [Candidatus Wolfebacteria bacterium]NCO44747.1 hypothetical protein [Candidatus Wolfebacteria bacterium]PIW34722.1 MAG: hypothetical protein COW25_02440 [Candidatus Nealsonbacteria bacterium CG15_BIG_FIL_POST_REV_8_21_14_020_37_12]PIZ45124.1 MAG: hypothetical protein COY31_00995 [Candidatus Wolfebacteria bacterium CG_4_10_14_0_2_um_filter_39_18]
MSNKFYLIAVFAILAGAIGFLVWEQFRTNQASPELDAFAKCLASKGITMYGTEPCAWCQKQKADFKSAWQYVNYVDCFKDPNRCVAEKIEGAPTWIFPNDNNKKISGYRELKVLSGESGCPLE